MQEVILLADVEHLGSLGSIVKVAPGYARNYLLPRQLAREANSKNKRQLAHDKRLAAHMRDKAQRAAAAIKTQVEALKVQIARKVGEQGKLFGAVSTHDVHAALLAQGVNLERHKIMLREPIKALGDYSIEVKLTGNVKTTLQLQVVAENSPPEA